MFKCAWEQCNNEWSGMLGDDEVPDMCPDCGSEVVEVNVRYKVWVHVERIDEDADEYEDVGLPDNIGVFGTLDDANAFVAGLLERHAPEVLATSDSRSCATCYYGPDNCGACKDASRVGWKGKGVEGGVEPSVPGQIDCTDVTAATAAKRLYKYLRGLCEEMGLNPDIEMGLWSPEKTWEMGYTRGCWTVVWESGPYEWALYLAGGGSLYGSYKNPPEVKVHEAKRYMAEPYNPWMLCFYPE